MHTLAARTGAGLAFGCIHSPAASGPDASCSWHGGELLRMCGRRQYHLLLSIERYRRGGTLRGTTTTAEGVVRVREHSARRGWSGPRVCSHRRGTIRIELPYCLQAWHESGEVLRCLVLACFWYSGAAGPRMVTCLILQGRPRTAWFVALMAFGVFLDEA